MEYKLVYTATGEEVNEWFTDLESAEKRAKELSLAEHKLRPDDVDEDGKIFIMDWLGFNKPYYGDESKFVQWITVEEIEEEETI